MVPNPASGRRRAGLAAGALAASALAVSEIERTALHDDAAQYWAMAGRLQSTGQPFYVGAVDHKGPLWVGVYRAAWSITGDQRIFWWLMAVAVVMLGLAIVAAVSWMLRSMDVTPRVVAATATIGGLYVLFGPESWNDLLYGRNITAALTAVAAALSWESSVADSPVADSSVERSSRNRHLCALGAGVAIGFAVQTVPTTAITLCAFGALLLPRWRTLRTYLVGAVAALLTAPVWYMAKGAGPDMVTYLWDYNLAYASDSTPAERITAGLAALVGHMAVRPYLLLGFVGAALAVRTPDRRLRFAAVWWVAELAAIAAPDRWFAHYWILLVAPTLLIGALLVERVRATRAAAGIALVWVLPGIVIAVTTALTAGGIDARFDDRRVAQSPRIAELRSQVDELSARSDPVFVWASAAGPYVALDRPMATRFDRRNWLTGEVYESETTAVLPGAWGQLVDDLDHSRPRVIVEYLDREIPADSPLAALIAERYTLHADTELARVWARAT